MRTISPALLAHLQGDVLTTATLWLATRTDGTVFAFTDFDQPIVYGGVTYASKGGYTHSQIDMTSDLSTSNLEIGAIFDSSLITPQSLEAGLWDYAAVSISLVNYADLTMGAVSLGNGVLGQVTLTNGQYNVELRGLAQLMQQDMGEVYSPTCRATFGDSRCTINLVPLTFSGTVQSVNGVTSWNDASLTQTGPAVPYADTHGQRVPSTTPWQLQIVPPAGGAFLTDGRVIDVSGNQWQSVGGSPGNDQYNVSGTGLYTFNSSQEGEEVFIDFDYQMGFFSYGMVKFTGGLNAGYSMEVKQFAPGVVALTMAMPNPIAVGDTYTIIAGCDRQFGTCKNRFNNVVHFRGEPYTPGVDTMLRPQQSS